MSGSENDSSVAAYDHHHLRDLAERMKKKAQWAHDCGVGMVRIHRGDAEVIAAVIELLLDGNIQNGK